MARMSECGMSISRVLEARAPGSPRSKAMKRYYFDMRDGDGFAPDEEGLELPDIEAAREEAALSLADMARDAVRISRRNARLMQIEVRNDNGPVLQAKFVFAIDRKK
jgi:hypothetical protein